MSDIVSKTREWRHVDAATFHTEIVPLAQPAVLKGLIAHWPAVKQGLSSHHALANYLRALDHGEQIDTFNGDPQIRGRFFYQPDVQGVNFERRKRSLTELIDDVLGQATVPEPRSVYAGSVTLPQVLPEFGSQNALTLLPASVMPRIWIGNAITVPAHYDLSANIACVVGGRRRFTFFPPEQLVNLYVGPLDFTLAGQPVSMVDIEAPDLDRYPRFAEAREHAQYAELEPGDAVFVPHLWWHHVKSLDVFNVLVNYWWDDAKPWAGSPFEALVHGLLAIRELPEPQRRAWRLMFDHYVFRMGEDPAAHLPPQSLGVLGPLTSDLAGRIRLFLMHGLSNR
ncbi:MAG: cupin-like domain-containing protein [Povalibacter sp.]